MTPGEIVVNEFGGIREAARQLGLAPNAVFLWKKSGVVPTRSLKLVLEVAKLKKLKITEKDLIYGR